MFRKMRKNLFVIFCGLLVHAVVFSQNEKNVEFTTQNFPNDKVKVTTYAKQVKKGEAIFNKIDKNKLPLTEAQLVISYLLGPATFNIQNGSVNYMLGVSYFWLNNYAEADLYLTRASKIESAYAERAIYYTGVNAYKNKNFDKSVLHLEKYIELNKKDALQESAKRYLLQANIASSAINNPVVMKTEEIQNIGQDASVLFPIVAPDGTWLMYNKLGKDAKGKETVKIFWMKLNEQLKPIDFPEEIPLLNLMNRTYQVVSVNTKGNKLLLRAKDKKGKYDIYQSEWLVNQWSNPSLLPSTINSSSDEIFATYAQNDSLIYVVSDRAEGYGGYDIWVTQMNRFGHWERVENAGNIINSPFNEITVVAEGTMLYVSSDRAQSMGGYDIFRMRKKDGKWNRAVNLGYPINTLENEIYFAPFIGKMQGIIVYTDNNRQNPQIKRIFLPPPAKEPALIYEELQLSFPKLIGKKNVIPADE